MLVSSFCQLCKSYLVFPDMGTHVDILQENISDLVQWIKIRQGIDEM